MAVKKTSSAKKASDKKTSEKTEQAALKKVMGAGGSTKKKAPKKAASRTHPFAILLIMGLVAVIIFMVNKLYFSKDEVPASAVISSDSKPAIAIREMRRDAIGDNAEQPKKKGEDQKDIPGRAVSRQVKNLETKKVKESQGPDEKIEAPNEDRKKSAPPQKAVKIYLVRFDERTEKTNLMPVSRTVDASSMLEESLKKLISGPTPDEEKRGLLTAIPRNLRLRGIKVINRTAEIDFNSVLEEGGTGNILIHRIDQIIYTATQFNTVKNVIIKVDGKRRRTLGSDGLSIGAPLYRGK